MPPASQRKMVRTYLDEIPHGNEEFHEQEIKKNRAERKVLTDGATDRILYKDIIRIAWPSLLELMLTSLVSMVDMMMVGSMADGTRRHLLGLPGDAAPLHLYDNDHVPQHRRHRRRRPRPRTQ